MSFPTGYVVILQGVNDHVTIQAMLQTYFGMFATFDIFALRKLKPNQFIFVSCTVGDRCTTIGTFSGDDCYGDTTGNSGCGVTSNDASSY